MPKDKWDALKESVESCRDKEYQYATERFIERMRLFELIPANEEIRLGIIEDYFRELSNARYRKTLKLSLKLWIPFSVAVTLFLTLGLCDFLRDLVK